MNAILFHIPHASTVIPEEYRSDFLPCLEGNLLRMTDWYTDELFDFGIGDRLVFPVSRLLCDPERFRNDDEEEMAAIGMGAIYTAGFDLTPLRHDLTAEKREEILRTYYDPHHRALASMVSDRLARFGCCTLIDCHSFSAEPLPYEKDDLRPDICIGTDSFHTPEWLAESLAESFQTMGYTVSLNRPYAGTMVPLKFYHKDRSVLSVMIEVNRGLYLAEDIEKKTTFLKVKQDLQTMVRTISNMIP